MKTTVVFFTLVFVSLLAFTQNPNADEILKEGKMLYRLQKIKGLAYENFLVDIPEKKDSIAGYFSYFSDDYQISTIFLSTNDSTKIVARYVYEGVELKNSYYNETLNKQQKDLATMYYDAISQVYYRNSDNFFKFYNNTSFELIPLITNDKRRVFILTKLDSKNAIILGNDYVLTYDQNNMLVDKKLIHNELTRISYSGDTNGDVVYSIHYHDGNEIITSTDVCILLLAGDIAEWTEHYVVNKNYVSVFNLQDESIEILKIKTFKKLNKNVID